MISVITMLVFLCLIVGKGIAEQEQMQVQYSMYYKYYEEERAYNDWIDSLLTGTQSEDYVYALVWVDDENADFSWRSCDDRESLEEAFTEEKESIPQRDEDAALWYYMKLRLDEDIHGIDIYEYLEQNLPEEGDECYAHTLEGGCAYYIVGT